jgi:hypothetical protein
MSDAWTNDAPAAPAATLPKAPWEMDAPASGVTPQQKAVVQANDNAEEAARAFSVSKKLAVPAPVVQSDLPGYNAQERTNSAKRAAENPAVQRYIQGNPIAASASADDWDGMEEASAALRLLHPELMARKVNGGLIAAVPEIASLAGTPQGREKLYGALTQLPKALAEGIVDFFKTPGDVAAGKIDLTTQEGLDKGISFGIGVSLGGRDIRVGKPARVEVRGGEFVSFDEFMAHVRGFTTRAEIDAFLREKADAGGPPGAMLQITKAEAGAEALSKAVEVVQNSKTKTRSPDLFEEFGNAHDAGSVHIDAAKVLELYQREGKVPAAGDGLFGFVPGLAEKAQAAAATGGELTIPVGQYIAHVDPTVHEGLRANVRLHDDGVTLEEAKEVETTLGNEVVVYPAVMVDGKVYTGSFHADAIETAAREKGETFDALIDRLGKRDAEGEIGYADVDGFVTSTGRFVSRAEAGEIAKKNNQIEPGFEDLDNTLLSADVLKTFDDAEVYKKTDKIIRGETVKQKRILYLNQLFKDAESIGLTEPEFKRYSDKIQRAETYVLERAIKFNRARIAKSVSAEWKRNEAAVRDEVTRELTDTGAFAAERYLRQQGIDIAHERAAEVADDLAPLFGFETGQDLLRGLESIEIERAASKKGPQAQLRDAIKERTAALMEERYGRLAENIAQEAREIALADHSFDIMAEEVSILAKLAKSTPPLTRSEMVVWAKEQFENTVVADAANYDKLSRAVAKGGREAEKALLKGDFVEAFQAKQRQMLAAVLAKESLALQRLIDRTEAKIDRFTSEPTIKSIDQGHLEQIREMLASVGIPQVHAPSAPPMELRDFVADSNGQLAVASWLWERSVPKITDMSVAQFREFADSLKSMEHVGRQATKVMNMHGEADLQNFIFDAVSQLQRFDKIVQPYNPSVNQAARAAGRRLIGYHLLVEKMFDYSDQFNPHGPITEWLDRPLRDSYNKELQLTEQVTKMIRAMPRGDTTAAELIPNNLIPDQFSKTGFMQMTRQNLREIMLNMGNFSNIQKLAEGFGLNEADLRRFVDANATAKDVAYVNSMWAIFKHLKPEADAVQLRDTGVPVKSIPAVPWDIKAGTLEGGYYPIVYDPYNSNIKGHLASKNSLFDKKYVHASTTQGYTMDRTEYTGALDLTGTFITSRITSMIHDIAFREAVRNAGKIVNNQEFRTAVAQYWGKETADLLPGWLKDIANSHTLDSDYAIGLARAIALTRQNVVSTLVGWNPGTMIKHGFTAAVMSAYRVGLIDFAAAVKELGVKDAAKTALDLVKRDESVVVPDQDFIDAFRDSLASGEREGSVRQFALQSSALLRNRNKQVDDTIRGAVDKLNEIGALGAFKNVRDKNILWGRLMLAYFDQMSTVPTWWASYKHAFERGENHADSVFIADKEVSRTHGSNFVGDQPYVTRLGNTPMAEFMKSFTAFYKFYNHFANMNFQFVWDVNAALRGPAELAPPGSPPPLPPGGIDAVPNAEGGWNYAPEPGANAAQISKWVGAVLLTLLVEEMSAPALDKDKKGFLHSMAMKAVHLFGGQFVGLREFTSGLSHGYGPGSGLYGTVVKAGEETVKDIAKAGGFKAGTAKNAIKNTAMAIGFMTGLGFGAQAGRTGQFLTNVARGQERPRTQSEWRQGLRTGSMKARVH